MIQSLKIKNFLSFRDEVVLSFLATADKNNEDYLVAQVAPNVRLTKLGIVYGANASGKSNLLEAIEFLKEFWFTTTKDKDQEIKATPFLLDEVSRKQPSEFELTFYIDGRKNVYKLVVNQFMVLDETLKTYPGQRPATIFKRHAIKNVSKITFNKSLGLSKAATEQLNLACLSNMSLFAAYNKVNVLIPELDIIVDWLKNQIFRVVKPNTFLTDYVQTLLLKDESKKASILSYLNEADFNISDINVQIEEQVIDAVIITKILNASTSMPESEKERLRKDRTIPVPKTSFSHRVVSREGKESFFDLPDLLQSKGTIRTMGLAGVINEAILQNAFIAIDEIESSLHPKLVEFIIESFLKQSNKAQLLLTTHYDGLLEEEELFRNDTIWFTNKVENGSTELYSLSDFTGISRISSLQKAYKYGKFGATPNI